MKTPVVILLVLLSTLGHAGEGKGKILSLKASGVNPAVLVEISQPIADTPRCNELGMFSINFAVPGSRNVYDLVKLAFDEGINVYIEGLGTCSSFWKAEDIKEITLFH